MAVRSHRRIAARRRAHRDPLPSHVGAGRRKQGKLSVQHRPRYTSPISPNAALLSFPCFVSRHLHYDAAGPARAAGDGALCRSAAAGARARSAVRAQDARCVGAEGGRRARQGDRRFARARRAAAIVAAQDRVRHGAADHRASRGDREGAAGASADRRLRRDRLRQDDAAAEDLPRSRARRARADRSHAAATHRRARDRQSRRRGARHERRRRCRLPGALHRSHRAGLRGSS